MNIGIFAGTFDPIHNGHIEFAKKGIVEAGLDRVIIVAEKSPYRKKPHASWDHRQAMIERSTHDIQSVDHDYQFASQLAHQHTMKDMLAVAERQYGSGNTFWFLVGSDVYQHMHQWHDLVKDHEYGGFVVALRDDHTIEWLKQKQEEAGAHGITAKTIVIVNDHPHVSSSAIRSAVKSQTEAKTIPHNIVDYIEQHGLYSN